MKTKHMLFLHLGVSLLFLASCKKDEFKEPFTDQSEILNTPLSENLQWSQSNEENISSYTYSLKDNSISSSVVTNGLVLVYYKNQSGIFINLPASSPSGGYWYYKVGDGVVDIIYSIENKDVKPDINNFHLVVFTPERLQDLKKSGTNINALIGLDYDSAMTLTH